MTTLITGGTGFIGAEIARMLVGQGEDVHVAHRSGNLGRLEGIADQVQLHQFDLSDQGALQPYSRRSRPRGCFILGPFSLLRGRKTLKPYSKLMPPDSSKLLKQHALQELDK